MEVLTVIIKQKFHSLSNFISGRHRSLFKVQEKWVLLGNKKSASSLHVQPFPSKQFETFAGFLNHRGSERRWLTQVFARVT